MAKRTTPSTRLFYDTIIARICLKTLLFQTAGMEAQELENAPEEAGVNSQ
jgi:hypothetical protein